MDIQIYSKQLHRGQRTVKHYARRFNVVICGRRWGKTDYSVELCLESILLGHFVGLYAPVFKDIVDTWNAIKARLKPLISKIDESKYIIHFITGGKIEFWSLKDKSCKEVSRGRKYHRVIYDETQKIDSEVLEENWEGVVAITLTDFMGDAFFFGTPPDSKMHYFYKLYAKGAVNSRAARGHDVTIPDEISANPNPDFISFRAPTSSNPFISIQSIEAIKKVISSVSFSQEIECQFIESSEAMFLAVLKNIPLQQKIFSRSNLLNKGLRCTLTFDFNKRPMAAVLMQHTPNYDLILAVKEFGAPEGQQVSIQYTCAQIRLYFLEQYGVKFGRQGTAVIPCPLEIRVTGDASGTTSHGLDKDLTRNFFTEIRDELGIPDRNFALKPSNPLHREVWHQMNDYLELHPDIYVCPNQCPRLKTDMITCRSTGEKRIDKAYYDPHYFDAFRYFFSTFLPQKFKPNEMQLIKINNQNKENAEKNLGKNA